MASKYNVTVFGYICPPEVDVYADLPEFEPEFNVKVSYYKGCGPSMSDPGEPSSLEIDDIAYVDGTPMSAAEADYWTTELEDTIADKVWDAR